MENELVHLPEHPVGEKQVEGEVSAEHLILTNKLEQLLKHSAVVRLGMTLALSLREEIVTCPVSKSKYMYKNICIYNRIQLMYIVLIIKNIYTCI